MQAFFPEVKKYSRCFPIDFLVRNQDVLTKETIIQVDDQFFEMFSFPFIRGDAAAAFVDERGLVLTQSAARRLCGHRHA